MTEGEFIHGLSTLNVFLSQSPVRSLRININGNDHLGGRSLNSRVISLLGSRVTQFGAAPAIAQSRGKPIRLALIHESEK